MIALYRAPGAGYLFYVVNLPAYRLFAIGCSRHDDKTVCMNVFVTRVLPGIAIDLLQQAGCSITVHSEKRDLSQQELIAACKAHNALLSAGHTSLDEHFLEACSHLKVIALYSAGFDRVDVPAATRLKIPVGNTPGALNKATADTAFLLMLAVTRKAFYMHGKIGRNEWSFYDPLGDLGTELDGKTLGVFGLGNIGFELARRCHKAYDMKVIYHNRGHNPKAEKELGAVRVSFDELLERSDVLSVHSWLSPETQGLFNKDAFSKMKPSSVFINTARGAIHNEQDLTEALRAGTIWGAGLDVTNPEPMQPGNPLLDMPNVAVLPHIGSATIEARTGMAEMAAKNIIAGLRGQRLPYIVNPEVYDR